MKNRVKLLLIRFTTIAFATDLNHNFAFYFFFHKISSTTFFDLFSRTGNFFHVNDFLFHNEKAKEQICTTAL